MLQCSIAMPYDLIEKFINTDFKHRIITLGQDEKTWLTKKNRSLTQKH